MSCLTDEEKKLAKFCCEFYLQNLDPDTVELTDEVYDLIDALMVNGQEVE